MTDNAEVSRKGREMADEKGTAYDEESNIVEEEREENVRKREIIKVGKKMTKEKRARGDNEKR